MSGRRPTIAETEANIERGIGAVTQSHAEAVKPRQPNIEQYLSCDKLHQSIDNLVGDLVRYDSMTLGSPLMGKAIDALEKHEPPPACQKFPRQRGPRVQT